MRRSVGRGLSFLRELLACINDRQRDLESWILKLDQHFYALQLGIPNRVERQIGLFEIKSVGIVLGPLVRTGVEEARLSAAQQNFHPKNESSNVHIPCERGNFD